MIDPVERIVNLALYFADAKGPVTAEKIRSQVAGYPEDQDAVAFGRMLERDKDELRRSGFTIVFDDATQVYSLDRSATFSATLELSGEEAAAITAAGSALVDDPSFPFAADLRLALAKIGTALDSGDVSAAILLADEDPARQASFVADLADAAVRGKTARFGYTNSHGASAPHEVDPYGLFLHDGRWYLVASDRALDEVRTYAVARMTDLSINPSAPKTPDFERPADFEVAGFIRLPFQYGPASEAFDAVLRFPEGHEWRTRSLTAGQGRIEAGEEGATWHIEARSPERLLRFVVENGPGIELLEPADLAVRLRIAMTEVEALHA